MLTRGFCVCGVTRTRRIRITLSFVSLLPRSSPLTRQLLLGEIKVEKYKKEKENGKKKIQYRVSQEAFVLDCSSLAQADWVCRRYIQICFYYGNEETVDVTDQPVSQSLVVEMCSGLFRLAHESSKRIIQTLDVKKIKKVGGSNNEQVFFFNRLTHRCSLIFYLTDSSNIFFSAPNIDETQLTGVLHRTYAQQG